MTAQEYTHAHDQGRETLARVGAVIVSQTVGPYSASRTWRDFDGREWLEIESNDGTGQTFEYQLSRTEAIR